MDIPMVVPAPEAAPAPSSGTSRQTSSTDDGGFAKALNASMNESQSSAKETKQAGDTSNTDNKQEDKPEEKSTPTTDAMLAAMIVPNQAVVVAPDNQTVQNQANVNEESVTSVDANKTAGTVIAAPDQKSSQSADIPDIASNAEKQSNAFAAKMADTSQAKQPDAQVSNDVQVASNTPDQTAKQDKAVDAQVPEARENDSEKTAPLLNRKNAHQAAQNADQQTVSAANSQQTGQNANQFGGNNQSSNESFSEAMTAKAASKVEKSGDEKASTGFEVRTDIASNQATAKPGSSVTSSAAVADKSTAATADADLHNHIIDQVVREVKLSQANGKSTLVVRLDPPELGSLQVRIMQDAQGITSQIQASSDQVRGLLQSHVSTLMEALAGAGIKMDSVSVTSGASFGSFMQGSAQNFGSGSMHQQSNGSQRQSYSGNSTVSVPSVAAFEDGSQGTAANVGYSWLA